MSEREAEAWACAKAVCRFCREGWAVHLRPDGLWLHYPDYAPEPTICGAAAIQDRISKPETEVSR